MTGNEAIAKILKAEGLDWFSCFPHHPLIDACAIEGLRPILCRQERAGVNIADGFSRIRNGNTIGVFIDADGSGRGERLRGRGAGLRGTPCPSSCSRAVRRGPVPAPAWPSNRWRNYRGITKWVSNINSAARIPEMMGRAYSLLKQGKPGPVMLEIPGDVGEEEIPDDAFSYTPIKPFRSGATPEDVRDLVSALLKAECPVISAGQGVLYAEATDALIEFAEWTKTPVMTTLAGKSAFPETHPLSLGTGAASHSLMVAEYLKKTDFFFGIGTSMTSGFKSDVPAGAALAQCVVSHGDLNREHRVDYGAVGDARVVLRQMGRWKRNDSSTGGPGTTKRATSGKSPG